MPLQHFRWLRTAGIRAWKRSTVYSRLLLTSTSRCRCSHLSNNSTAHWRSLKDGRRPESTKLQSLKKVLGVLVSQEMRSPKGLSVSIGPYPWKARSGQAFDVLILAWHSGSCFRAWSRNSRHVEPASFSVGLATGTPRAFTHSADGVGPDPLITARVVPGLAKSEFSTELALTNKCHFSRKFMGLRSLILRHSPNYAPPKTNIESENHPFEKGISSSNHWFLSSILVVGGVSVYMSERGLACGCFYLLKVGSWDLQIWFIWGSIRWAIPIAVRKTPLVYGILGIILPNYMWIIINWVMVSKDFAFSPRNLGKWSNVMSRLFKRVAQPPPGHWIYRKQHRNSR